MKYLFFLLFSGVLLAQNNLVIYTANQFQNKEFKNKITSDLKNTLDQAKQKVLDLKIELIFNDSVSVFKLSDTYKASTLEEKLATVKAGISSKRYINFKKNKSFYNNNGNPIFGENEFLIYDNLDFDWKILNEEKKIDNFKVIKATGTANKSERKVTVIAWFAPEIPFRHGPYGVGNLPGLILEMQIGDVHYTAKEIVLNKSAKEIDFPNKGKLIHVQDYYLLQKERLEELKKSFK